MISEVFLVLIAFIAPLNAHSQESCKTEIISYHDAIRCAEEKSPKVQTTRLELERAKSLVKSAAQWKNPQLSAESVHGSSGSESLSETEFSLGIPIELGGKRSARTDLAKSSVTQAEAALLEARINARGAALLKLHRVRQILHELEVIEESISTFTKLLAQYGRRPKLSPEQELSAAVFRMAKSDYELKKAMALDEIADLNTYLRVHLGTDVESLKKDLPPAPKNWPMIGSDLNIAESPRLKTFKAQMESAQAELNLARSQSWPTLMIGPSMKIQNEMGRSEKLYGLNLSLPLPLFNMNGPGRAAASTGVELAETRKSLALNKLEQEVEELSRTYKRSVEVLASTLSHQEIEKRHADTERLFLRGIVPSALVIEAHRTFVELEQSRNERETKALEALMALYALTGEMPEVSL